jgi:hypothetical protein
VTDAKCDRQFVHGHHSGIAVAAFKAAEVLLAETRNIRKLLLRQTLLQPYPPDVLTYQRAHIHAQRSPDYILQVYQL